MPGELKNGNPTGKGGARPGAGRKPDWFKKKCQQLATSPKAIRFLQAMINGDPIEEKMQMGPAKDPVKIMVSASPESRVKAWATVCERGFGKAPQDVKVGGEIVHKHGVILLPANA